MRSSYKRIGDYITRLNEKNKESIYSRLLGININKYFMPSVANVVGTDLSKYKIVAPGQFACNRMHVGRDYRLPIALSKEENPFLVSPAYDVFKINDTNKLLPEYLMMWFSRSEFDRNSWFYTDTDVSGKLGWDSFCEMELPVPSISTQQAIVDEYNAIVNRISLNEQLNAKLEETAQALYKHWFESDQKEDWDEIKLEKVCNLITDGKHGNCQDEADSGYYFISVKDISNSNIYYSEARQITKSDFEETHRRTNLEKGDILMSNAGTIGRLAIAKNIPETRKTTFQKSVAIIKPNKDFISSYFLYSMLNFNIREIKELAGGSTQSNLLLGDLKSFKFVYPKIENVKRFEHKVTPIFLNLELNWSENIALEKMRDLLLSKMATVGSKEEIATN
ncbi:MAG: restriction endonuclease subunit S [Patiriisocius sp.]|uniref:restriction endonuclease subunit S n=1 Tax=Patiriisocius sp. TaxID=2822396 RepID=UPI003EF1E7D7